MAFMSLASDLMAIATELTSLQSHGMIMSCVCHFLLRDSGPLRYSADLSLQVKDINKNGQAAVALTKDTNQVQNSKSSKALGFC